MQRLTIQRIRGLACFAAFTFCLAAFVDQPAKAVQNTAVPALHPPVALISAATSVRFFRTSASSVTARTPQTTKANCASTPKPTPSPIWERAGEPSSAAIRSRASWCDASQPKMNRCGCRRSIPTHKLTKQEIERLTEWIAQGAPWQQHWAFIAPVRPPAPAVKNRRLASQCDRFLRAGQARAGRLDSRRPKQIERP